MIRVALLKLPLDIDLGSLKGALAARLGVDPMTIEGLTPRKCAVDARDKRDVHKVWTVDAKLHPDTEQALIKRAPGGLQISQADEAAAAGLTCAITTPECSGGHAGVPGMGLTAHPPLATGSESSKAPAMGNMDHPPLAAGVDNPEAPATRSMKHPPLAAATHLNPPPRRSFDHPPLVVGAGPAGLFAALTLAQAGIPPILIERGRDVDRRAQDVSRFWQTGDLDEHSNVQFGEGGAGAFSDGKLTTGTKDPRAQWVRDTLVALGAPEEIAYLAKPHIGTDKLPGVVKNLRRELIRLGTQVRFETTLTGLTIKEGRITGARLNTPHGIEEIETSRIILALGHSARDTVAALLAQGVPMQPKAFSVGVRIEHPQRLIDRAQYGDAARHVGPTGTSPLGAAEYKLACHLPGGRSVYTFCMCPGGEVVAAASEGGHVVTNGMSAYGRSGQSANSALLVGVEPSDFPDGTPLGGFAYQRRYEALAFQAGGGGYRAPAQTVADFLAGQTGGAQSAVKPTYRPGITPARLDRCLPDYVIAALKAAIPMFDRKLRGFALPGALLTGVETRSSSPVRILRDERCMSAIGGLYPCGEGAGYAGGILSCAVDGIRCAQALLKTD